VHIPIWRPLAVFAASTLVAPPPVSAQTAGISGQIRYYASGQPVSGVTEYPHTLGCSVTGGAVYRGAMFPCMHGVYFYADYCSGRIWGLQRAGDTFQNMLLYDAPFSITSFGEDEAGGLWITDYSSGRIAQLTDACAGRTSTPAPTRAPTPAQ
jgi:hypothetical protein